METDDAEEKIVRASPFTEKDREERLKELDGLSIEELKDLVLDAEDSAVKDRLTGWYSRSAGMGIALNGVGYSRRHGNDMWMVMLDFDRFKAINDTKGHKFGDSVLKQTGMTVKKNLRAGETMTRYGGDETMLIIPEGTADSVEKAIERINEEIKEDLSYLFEEDEEDLIPKFSWGKASLSEVLEENSGLTNVDALSKMIKVADDRLYEAKTREKNG